MNEIPPGTPRRPPRRPPRWPVWLPLGVLLVAVVAFLAYRVWWSRPPDPGPAPPHSPAATEPAPPPSKRDAGVEPLPIDLPALEGSDGTVRELAARLSSHPKLAAWLTNRNLIRKFVATVANVAEGANPRPHLGFLVPSEPFYAREDAGRWLIDPRGYRRYDRVADVIESLDARGCAQIYLTFKPLLQKAYDDLGYPGRDFDRAMAGAIDHLLGTPVVTGDVELVPGVATYTFVDPALESLSPPRKLMLRTGPRNVQKIQAKLREFASVLGWDVSAGPR